MRKLLSFYLVLLTLICCNTLVFANGGDDEISLERRKIIIDSIHQSMKYQHGIIELNNDMATIDVPAGFKFLDAPQSQYVLENLWGNPPDKDILGMLFPEKLNPLDSSSWAFVVTFTDMGYVKDDDADKINYTDLLKEMKEDTKASSEARVSEGYEPIELINWASPPFYDKERKALHWAKEIRFGTGLSNTLNYDVRLLGRKGVLSFNAVGSMEQLPDVKPQINNLIAATTFKEGHRYADFDPSIDKFAAVTIGGLVAGKVLAKVGALALIAKFGKVILLFLVKFWKLIAVAIVGAAASIRRFITGKSGDDTESEG